MQRLRELEFEAFILRHKLQQLGASAQTEQQARTSALSMRGAGAVVHGFPQVTAAHSPSMSPPSGAGHGLLWGAGGRGSLELLGLLSAAAADIGRPLKKRVTFSKVHSERVISQLYTAPGTQAIDSAPRLPSPVARDGSRGGTQFPVEAAPGCIFGRGPDNELSKWCSKKMLEKSIHLRTCGKLHSEMPPLYAQDEDVLASRRRKVPIGLAALLEACEIQLSSQDAISHAAARAVAQRVHVAEHNLHRPRASPTTEDDPLFPATVPSGI